VLKKYLFSLCLLTASQPAWSQIDEEQLGGWYTYQWTVNRTDSAIGFQGDMQLRYWDLAQDKEQRLVRGGITWQAKDSRIKYTLGAAHIVSGAFGKSNATTEETRLYQEALMPAKLGERGFITHRLRFEQRDLDGQELRTRLRYLIGYNHPLNQATLAKGAIYLTVSNEFFLNLERGIGRGRSVDYYDRNRFAVGLGYSLGDTERVQLSYMQQSLDEIDKGQLQLNLIQTF
jgi:hypothetical protein